MSIASKPKSQRSVYMIGVAPDLRQGLAVFQQTCRYRDLRTSGLAHDCNTVNGSSG